jgi:hypothetical protein
MGKRRRPAPKCLHFEQCTDANVNKLLIQHATFVMMLVLYVGYSVFIDLERTKQLALDLERTSLDLERTNLDLERTSLDLERTRVETEARHALETLNTDTQLRLARTEADKKLAIERARIESERHLQQFNIEVEKNLSIAKAKIEAELRMEMKALEEKQKRSEMEAEHRTQRHRIDTEKLSQLEKAKIEAEKQAQLEINRRQNLLEQERIQAMERIEKEKCATEIRVEKERSERHKMDVQKEMFQAASEKRLVRESTRRDNGVFSSSSHTDREYRSLIDEHGTGAFLGIGHNTGNHGHYDDDL